MKRHDGKRGFRLEAALCRGPFVLCLLLILTPTMAGTDTPGDQLNRARQQLKADYDKRAGLVQARAALKSQSADLSVAVEAFGKQEARVSQEMKDLTGEIAEVNKEAKHHNEAGCVFSPDHPNACIDFDAETRRLRAARAALLKSEGPVTADKDQLEAARLRTNADTEAWNAAVRKNDSEYNGNEKEIASLLTSLDRLRREYDDCVRSQRKHQAGKERAACGSPGSDHDDHPPEKRDGGN